ncbi:MAG TPA: winged helix-turn-helix domain-containing protein [Pyrinomonadaceae bacterium]|nr:winged helix-turn-helix domain-containing protein [Pyrinomonadaceae bacterium]
MNSQQHVYEFGPFRVDALKRVLWRDGEPVQLTSKSLDTLLILVSQPGEIVTKDDLMKAVWPDTVVEENNLTQQISMLRKALGEKVGEHRYLVTVPGRGYCFVAEVRVTDNCDLTLVPDSREVNLVSGKRDLNLVVEQHLSSHITIDVDKRQEQPAALIHFPRRVFRSRVVVSASLGLSLLVLLAYGITWRRARQAESRSGPRSIAVLPFKPINSDPANVYLSTGMADALITRLSNLRQISVRPTSTIFKYADQQPNAQMIGRELAVDSVLEGTVQKLDQRVRVSVQLVEVRSGTPIWAQTFDQEMNDIFSLQDAISEQVAQSMTVQLNGADREHIRKRSTENLAAYQAYLAGRYFWNQRNEEGLTKSLTHFQSAITLDANYAEAYTGLADAYTVAVAYHCPMDPAEAMQKARAAAVKAISINDQLAEAHASLAMIKTRSDHDFAGAETEYRRAIELNPDYATAHHWYSEFLAMSGRESEALTEIQAANVLDPLSPVIGTTLAERLFYARRYDEAIAQLRKTLDVSPEFRSAHFVMGLALEQKGMLDEAITELQKSRVSTTNDAFVDASLGHSYALAGRVAEARRILHQLLALKDSEPFEIAMLYQGLGQKQQALDWIERIESREGELSMMLRLDPRFDSVRSEPRFQKVLTKHNSSV